jgi:hypothetical protein
MKAIHRRRREAAYERGRIEYPVLLEEPTFRDLVCTYIGEGSKHSRNVVAVCNSDPAVVHLGATWIRHLASNPVVFSFQHHADQDPEDLCKFWAKVVALDPSSIKFQRKSNSGQLAGNMALATPICGPGSKRGWTACAPNGPRIRFSGRGSVW